MPEYGRFCPVSLSSEVLADRWTPLIVRELVLGNTRFNDIARGLPGISRTLLAQRLRHLERRGRRGALAVAHRPGSEYHLTPAGKDLEPVLEAIGRWAVEWLFDDFDPHEVDPLTLMWWMHRRMDADRFPGRRWWWSSTTPPRTPMTVWLVLDRGEPSVCMQHPGFDPDVVVRADHAGVATCSTAPAPGPGGRATATSRSGPVPAGARAADAGSSGARGPTRPGSGWPGPDIWA